MKLREEMNKLELATTFLCVAIGVVYLLGFMKLLPTLPRNTIIYCLALPMVIMLAINNKKRSKLIFVICIVGSVFIGLAAILSLIILFF